MEILERRKRLREEVLKRASAWAEALPFKASAFLIGSYARGDFNLWSDVDLLLILEGLRGSPLERLKALDIPPGFQVIPITKEEFRRLLAKGSPLSKEALETGIVLRDDLKLKMTTS
ncbi:nucleotidyltransferase domain-containing protein [Candidatus Bathyarchaeota archaeon]|nr:nucleotidyltransferase domain-containing protein [Candidatus Bathyarchaeota archaeon]MBS7628079.1 nucleotidyltransferase domain-containing protein [Candidatus Bathyarchaeota archaeon]